MVLGALGTLIKGLFSTNADGVVEFGSQFIIELIMLIIIIWFLDIVFHFGNGVK